jgi:hypothetical protein
MKRLIGWLLLLALGAGAVAILLTAFPVYGLLILWGGGGVALWWSVSRTPNHSPPPPEDPSPDEKPQVRVRTIEPDENNPHRHRVVWATEGTTE